MWTRRSRNSLSLFPDGLSWLTPRLRAEVIWGFALLCVGWLMLVHVWKWVSPCDLCWASLGFLTAWGLGSKGEYPGRGREPGGCHTTLDALVLEVTQHHGGCWASYKGQPRFQVHLIQMGKFWKMCGTGNTALVIFRKHYLPQWTIHQSSSINILNPPSDLAQLWSHKLVSYRPYIPAVYIFYLDCIRIKLQIILKNQDIFNYLEKLQ